MNKVKLVIVIFLVLGLAQAKLKSQDKNPNAPELSVNSPASDKNPQSKIFKLYQNQPAESEDITVIKFELQEDASVILNVFDSNGNINQNLIQGNMEPGIYNVIFKIPSNQAIDDFSYRIEVNGVAETKKMIAR